MNYSCMHARSFVLHLMHGMQRCQIETEEQVRTCRILHAHIRLRCLLDHSLVTRVLLKT